MDCVINSLLSLLAIAVIALTIAEKAFKYFTSYYDCITIDGVRIRFGDGWGLVRASNTQPVIVCRFEARTMERMEEIKSEILDKLTEFGEIKLEHC